MVVPVVVVVVPDTSVALETRAAIRHQKVTMVVKAHVTRSMVAVVVVGVEEQAGQTWA
jgi:hypothetical protein